MRRVRMPPPWAMASAALQPRTLARNFAAARATAQRPERVMVSEDRLRAFMQAEVAYWAGQDAKSITLQEVIDASTPSKAAWLAHEELPIRFAQRIKQVEALPFWQESEDLVTIHRMYTDSFQEIRLAEIERGDLDGFTEVIRSVKKRMQTVTPLLATAVRSLQGSHQEDIPDSFVDEWLDTFLLSRIGTEMLSTQFLTCVASSQKPKKTSGSFTGIVDNSCDPARVCQQAAHHARQLCRQHFQLSETVTITVEGPGSRVPVQSGQRIQFPYVPQYLFYIMVELLKNSARATVETCENRTSLKERPIVVTIGADLTQVAIRVRDRAGGIPFSERDRVWSYMYSTASKKGKAGAFVQEGTPLAGYGVGLPLSRLYARYLGGSLHLMTMPGIGTSAYLYLKRIESDARELIPDASGSSMGGSLGPFRSLSSTGGRSSTSEYDFGQHL